MTSNFQSRFSALKLGAYALQGLSVFALLISASGCGKSSEQKRAAEEGVVTAIATPSVAAAFEADCGADIPAAQSSSAFDLASCRLSDPQLAMIREVGPFKVEADCVRRSVRIKNQADEISGEAALNDDGTYSAQLAIGPRFNDIQGCPVRLEGIATGTVGCSPEKKVVKVEVNTAFNFASAEATGVWWRLSKSLRHSLRLRPILLRLRRRRPTRTATETAIVIAIMAVATPAVRSSSEREPSRRVARPSTRARPSRPAARSSKVASRRAARNTAEEAFRPTGSTRA